MATTKSGRQFRLAEVCRIADVQPYVLKYWETEFPALAAHRSGGQKSWSQEEVDLVLRIRELLYGEGFTIAGARKRLEAELAAPSGVEGDTAGTSRSPAPKKTPTRRAVQADPVVVQEIRADLKAILTMLED